MAELALNKSSLNKQSRRLRSYRKYLPSLDMKRRQLIAERTRAGRELQRLISGLEEYDVLIRDQLPMLSNQRVDLSELVKVTNVALRRENIVGTQVPRVESIDIEVRRYALLGKPHWVDLLAGYLQQALELRVAIQVARRRLALLKQATRIITQRVNLFDKVLIPVTINNIKRIKIHLSDKEREGIIHAKLAKKKLRETS